MGINQIIARAEIAKATFYQHFPSKEALCRTWLEIELERIEGEWARMLKDPRPVRERVEENFEDLRARLEASGYPACPFALNAAMSAPESSLRKPIEAYRARIRIFWRELAGQHEPRVKKAKALGDAWCLLHAGAMVEAYQTRAPWPLKKAKRAALMLGGWS